MDKDGRQLLAWIKDGRGQGHGESYQPWLRISRRGLPSKGNLSLRPIPALGRTANFLSANEASLAVWLLWLGASDLREQFPLWPLPHVHPIYGHSLADHGGLPWSRGTLAIAHDLGIEHGRFVGTNIPYIATTDLMLTVMYGGRPRLVAVAAKPGSEVGGESRLRSRARERLALEVAYANELGISWHLMSDRSVPPAVRENLDVAVSASKLPEKIPQNMVVDFCEGISELLRDGESIVVANERVQERLMLDTGMANGLFHHGLWSRKIPIDLREPLVFSRPAKLTDFSWAKRDAVAIFGEHDRE
ncbi:MAG: hypothetical protein EKK45_18505 [Curvibacter sp.]|nr:MAG: hypothetical protein EKK45_18505 [Curvibacter sp.]